MTHQQVSKSTNVTFQTELFVLSVFRCTLVFQHYFSYVLADSELTHSYALEPSILILIQCKKLHLKCKTDGQAQTLEPTSRERSGACEATKTAFRSGMCLFQTK